MRLPLAFMCAIALASCAIGTSEDENDRFPTSAAYPAGTMERFDFVGGGAEAWRISALRTPERPEANWKVVIITGTPSWSEYWAPTLANLPESREMVVADRPGFRGSEPVAAVGDLAKQAEALAPMLEAREGQRVLLVGQSFGAPIATLMAAQHPDQVHALVLMSAYFGDQGPTARRMFGAGRLLRPLLPRDLRNSITEVSAQTEQLPRVLAALGELSQPVVFVHGDEDTFVPLSADAQIAARHGHSMVTVPGGDHFLNACCVPALLGAMEQAIAQAESQDLPPPAETAR